MQKYLVKNTETNEILNKEIDIEHYTEILAKGEVLDLFEQGKFILATEQEKTDLAQQVLEKLKAIKISEIKTKASQVILNSYPDYTQRNILMFEAKSSQVFKDMTSFIANIIEQCQQLKDLVNSSRTTEEISQIEINYTIE